MDKRKVAQQRVKRCITAALFSLLEEKSLSDLRITEIIERAGVARASFYRNYRTKEDVLVTLIRDVLERFGDEMRLDQGTFYTYENVLLSFRYFQSNREYILDLYRSGFISVLMEELNRFHESVEGSMPVASIGKYELYIYIGALLNTALIWLTQDAETSPEELARFFLERISGMIGAGGNCEGMKMGEAERQS